MEVFNSFLIIGITIWIVYSIFILTKKIVKRREKMRQERDINIISQLRQRIRELERENKSLKIWLDMYEADATALIEEHGCDPDDKIDREILKRMLNYLIGENRRLKNAD